MNQPQTPCPQCGTDSKWIRNDAGPGRCANCGFPRLPLETSHLPHQRGCSATAHWASQILMMITRLGFTLVGAMLFLASVYSFVSTFHVLQGGVVSTKGRVTTVDVSKDKESSTISMEFTIVKNGIPNQIETSSSVSTPFLAGTPKRGQAVDIIYSASDPKIAITRNDLPSLLIASPLVFYMDVLFLCIGSATMIAAPFSILALIRDMLILYRLHIHGQHTQAIIIDRWETVSYIDEDGSASVATFVGYAYKTGASEQIHTNSECTSQWPPNQRLSQGRIGDRIPVLYLPNRPMISMAERS